MNNDNRKVLGIVARRATIERAGRDNRCPGRRFKVDIANTPSTDVKFQHTRINITTTQGKTSRYGPI